MCNALDFSAKGAAPKNALRMVGLKMMDKEAGSKEIMCKTADIFTCSAL